MFLKVRVKAAIAKFITQNGGHYSTLNFFESGPIEAFLPLVEHLRLDANQGAVAVITATITKGATNGVLTGLKQNVPRIYHDLGTLWVFCGELWASDPRRWEQAVILGELGTQNPFDYAARDSAIQHAIDHLF